MMTKRKTSKLRTAVWVFALGLGLAGCGEIIDTGQNMTPDSIYDLVPLSGSGNGDGASIQIDAATFPAYLGTVKIVVKPGSQEITYLAGARWSDQAPNLVSRFLMVSLENRGGFMVNSSRQGAMPTDYRLTLDIRDFSARASVGSAPTAEVELDITLIDSKTREVKGSKTFSGSVRASENSKAAIAAAFQSAMEGIAGELTAWLKAAQ